MKAVATQGQGRSRVPARDRISFPQSFQSVGSVGVASFANSGTSVPTAEQVKDWGPVREHVLWEAAESFPQAPAAKVQV